MIKNATQTKFYCVAMFLERGHEVFNLPLQIVYPLHQARYVSSLVFMFSVLLVPGTYTFC